ncbi:hypothetical protein VaNZ11_016893 [Volvox africanus]|uniref:Mitotic checkpoint protein MAD1 n=1 Tax=Volvox africanus TaxID=51714 RepID=A0ABQ5SPB0_9CHLO|nr:hypothetical protein VaNZ11_016893 [Volvox africanus]
MQPQTVEQNKRQRLALQTPGGAMPQGTGLATPASSILLSSTIDRLSGMPSNDGLMDYLRGRGGKIKDLEDELAQTRARCEKLQQELATKNESMAVLVTEKKVFEVAAAAVPPPTGTSTAVQHLHRQLDEQLHKGLMLEQNLAAAKQHEAVSAQRLASLEALLSEQRAEQAKLLAEAEAAAARLRVEVEAARAEAQMALRNGELAERAAQRRVEAEREILKVAQAQLEEVRSYAGNLKAELEQTRQRASRQEAEAAALRNSAQHVRLQLLEEELRNAREALASAQAAAAAVTATAHHQPSSTSAGPTARTQNEQVPVSAAASRRSGIYLGADAAAASGGATVATAVLGGGGGSTSGIDLEPAMADLPEALRPPWLSLVKVLGLPPGLPLVAQAAEAGRAAAALTEEVTDLRAAVKAQDESLMQLRAAASGSEAYATELQSQLADLRSRLERSLTAERVAVSRAAAIEQERDALRAALSSPTTTATTSRSADPSPHPPHPGSLSGRILAGQQAAAVEQLQLLNEGLQKQVSSLQQEVAASASAAEAQALAARAATARAEAAEQRIKQLEREADSLAAEVASLQERLGRGELIRAGGVRVLHLRHNPELEARQALREATVTRLTAENDALRGQVAELEAAMQKMQMTQPETQTQRGNNDLRCAPGDENSAVAATGPSTGDSAAAPPAAQQTTRGRIDAIPGPALGAGVAIAVKDAEITVLRRKVEECEKAMNRLKMVFKERITVFREACYSLFGYRVDMTAEATVAADAAGAPTTFTLKPQHADDPAALLVFRCTSGGGRMELVPNTFTRERLAREVETFVRKFNCIPALTANLTMDNFQKQTQC